MSVMDLAASARTSAAGYVVLHALESFPEYVDSDGYTRALAQRASDGAIVVVFARGAQHDIVGTHNERSRLTFERSALLKSAADESLTEPERKTSADLAEELTTELGSLVKTRAQATVHVARALTHYERAATDTSADSPAPSDEESGEESESASA